jgi:peptidyl-tRNA hydrolase
VHASDKAHKMSKEDKEKLRAKKQSYKELIKRSKKQREDRKRTKMNADALREEIDAGTKLVIVCACAN